MRPQGSKSAGADREGGEPHSLESERAEDFAAAAARDEAWFRYLTEKATEPLPAEAKKRRAAPVAEQIRIELARTAQASMGAALDEAVALREVWLAHLLGTARAEGEDGAAGTVSGRSAAPGCHPGWPIWSPLLRTAVATWSTVGGLFHLTCSLEALWFRRSQEALGQTARTFRSAQAALEDLMQVSHFPRPELARRRKAASPQKSLH